MAHSHPATHAKPQLCYSLPYDGRHDHQGGSQLPLELQGLAEQLHIGAMSNRDGYDSTIGRPSEEVLRLLEANPPVMTPAPPLEDRSKRGIRRSGEPGE